MGYTYSEGRFKLTRNRQTDTTKQYAVRSLDPGHENRYLQALFDFTHGYM